MFEFIKDCWEAFWGVFERRTTFSNYPFTLPLNPNHPFYIMQLNQLQHQWTPPIDYSGAILEVYLQDLELKELTKQWLTEIPNDIY